ncbi:MAG: hypothetical protein M3119_08415 [Verrucomicrobiota bacterium]|nr:hypothetical protein [Verrucomicrobiota bacterium]MDQ6940164.1 hypothetical protein [Verrucomicrobiota bacterium]
MNPDENKPTAPQVSRAPRRGLELMALVLVAMALLSIFANYEKRHLDRIEKVTIINSPPPPLPSPTQSPNE